VDPEQERFPVIQDRLTPRERQVLELRMLGMKSAAVASALEISTHTVRDHSKSAYRRLGAHTLVAAVREAVRRGEVSQAVVAAPPRAWNPFPYYGQPASE
jgi:DNA-binding CsgD family transcriptional regulator